MGYYRTTLSKGGLSMKIAISSTGPDLDAEVDPRFGRCEYFLIVEIEDMSFDVLPNTSMALEGGAGIQSAKLVVDKGAEAVVTGSVGPNASRVLSEAGLAIVTGVSGTIRDVALQYKKGTLEYVASETAPPRFVAGRGLGMDRGMGAGRGGGGRRGRGAGPPKFCVCPNCGERAAHRRGTPCFEQTCPKCGGTMTRE
jgi:predicted Fe-Mo cluster-binding NifX family protein